MKPKKIILPLLLATIFLLNSCKEEVSDVINFDRNILLQNYADNIIIPRFENLDTEVNLLNDYVNSLDVSQAPNNLQETRDAFLSAYTAWQACTSLDFGPSGMEAMKANVNSYPTDTTKIANNILSGDYTIGSASNIDASGFPALDFLLFTKSSFSTEELVYLKDICHHLTALSGTVLSEWQNAYKTQFIEADGTDAGSSLSLLINEMNFDYEKFIRDGKVGIPLGVRSLGTPQVEKVEALYSQKSVALLHESIIQLKNLYNGVSVSGTDGKGLDDYLIAVEAKHQDEDLNNKINTQFDKIITRIEGLNNQPLDQEILSNPADVQALYDDMQKLVVFLKVDMSSNLGVLISYQDNDGD